MGTLMEMPSLLQCGQILEPFGVRCSIYSELICV